MKYFLKILYFILLIVSIVAQNCGNSENEVINNVEKNVS